MLLECSYEEYDVAERIARPDRISYLRGDKWALGLGILLTLYAAGWFVNRMAEGLTRDRAVVPAHSNH